LLLELLTIVRRVIIIKLLKHCVAAVAFIAMGSAASAVTLTSLTGGGTLSEGGLFFDGFSYTDIGAGASALISVSSDDIDVTASVVGDVVTLSFDFSPSISLSTGEAYEIEGFFTATAAGATMVSIGILLGGETLTGDSLVAHKVGSHESGLLLGEDAVGSGFFAAFTGTFGPSVLANLMSNVFDWSSSGETDDLGSAGGAGPGTVSTDGFDIVITLERDVSPVPLPAALPLFGTALAGMGFIGWRRKRKAAA